MKAMNRVTYGIEVATIGIGERRLARRGDAAERSAVSW